MKRTSQTWLARLLAMFAVVAGLYVWPRLAGRLDCPASALWVAPLWMLVVSAALETAYLRRFAFISHYLRSEGRLSRLLRPRVLLTLWIVVKGLAFTLFLLTALLFLDSAQWLILAADALLMGLLLRVIRAFLHDEVHPSLCRPLTHLWGRRMNALLLWLLLVAQMFYLPQQNYSGFSWQEVVDFSAARVDVQCDALSFAARLSSVVEALSLWAAQNLFAEFKTAAGLLLAWLVFLTAFGVSFLFVWVFSYALVGVAARPWVLVCDFRHEEGQV